MPVQRIARYPLLLQTIQKHTDTQHPVYSLLEQTAHNAVQLNCRINEYKRFREVGKDVSSVQETFTTITQFALCKHGWQFIVCHCCFFYFFS